MSALNSTIITLENPSPLTKVNKEVYITESAESRLEIPADLLQRAILVCETKTELVVYLTILRYSLGFNRDKCSVSRRFIAAWTGLQYQNVGRGIEGLLAKGLVEKLPESTVKHGDMFRILHLSTTIPSEKTALTRNQNDYTQAVMCNQTDYTATPGCNQVENTQGVIKVMTERNQLDYEAASKRLRSVINPITKNKIEEEKESSSSSSEILKNYIQALPELHLQKIERSSLKQLLEGHSVAQVELALEYAQRQGTSGGEKIKLPLKYLATGSSMETVLIVAEKKRAEVQAKEQLVNLSLERKKQEAEKQRAQEENERSALRTFQQAYPDPEAQKCVLSEIIQSQFPRMNPQGNMAKSLALHYWFKSFHQPVNSVRNEGGVK